MGFPPYCVNFLLVSEKLMTSGLRKGTKMMKEEILERFENFLFNCDKTRSLKKRNASFVSDSRIKIDLR